MRVVFMGTPEFAATILQEMSTQHQLVAVYTRPDAVRGRGSALLPSPVKSAAQALGIPVFCPESLTNNEEQQRLRAFEPDVIVVAAYGALLPRAVCECARFGAINAHASLLPRWRGAAPVERALLAGDEQVGVCAMRVDEKLDAGPYCVSRSIPVLHRSAHVLLDELAHLGAEALLNALAQFEAGHVFWVEQDEAQVCYAKKIEKGELNLAVNDTAVQADRKVRASSEAHTCCCEIAGRRVVLLSAQEYDSCDILPEPLAAGQIVFAHKRLFLGMQQGMLEILTLKPQGKKEMDAKAFAAGIQNIKTNPTYWRPLGN